MSPLLGAFVALRLESQGLCPALIYVTPCRGFVLNISTAFQAKKVVNYI